MANKIFIQDPQLNIAASVPAAVNIGVQNVDTSSPVIGQFGQMLAQMVGQYQANKQQIDYADMQFELDQLEKQWHLNNTADPNVYKTEESRGNLAKSLNERLLQEQDIINKYRDKIGDENYYNFSKQFQLQLADEMAAIQTGINQGFIGEEYTRAVRRIDNNLDKVNDYKNVFNANDGALVLMRGHTLATSSLKYLNADDNETVYKGYENYFGTLQNAYKTKFIQDLYDNFSDGNGTLDIDGIKSYASKNRVETLSDENIRPVAKELYKSSPNLFNDEQDAFNYVKKKYEDTLNEIDKFVSKRKVEKEKDQALANQQNYLKMKEDFDQKQKLFEANVADKYDGTIIGSAFYEQNKRDGVYGNNQEWKLINSPLREDFVSTMSNAVSKGMSSYGKTPEDLTYIIKDNLMAALKRQKEIDPSFNYGVISDSQIDNLVQFLEKEIYYDGDFNIQSNPNKTKLVNTRMQNLMQSVLERNDSYNRQSKLKNSEFLTAVTTSLVSGQDKWEYTTGFFINTGTFPKVISGLAKMYPSNLELQKLNAMGDMITDEKGNNVLNPKKIEYFRKLDSTMVKNYIRSSGGQKLLMATIAGIDMSRINNAGQDMMNTRFDQTPDTDLVKKANSYLYGVGKDEKKVMPLHRSYVWKYVDRNYDVVDISDNNNINRNRKSAITQPISDTMNAAIMNSNGGTNKEAFNEFLVNDVNPQDPYYNKMYDERKMKGQTPKEDTLNKQQDIKSKPLSKQKKWSENGSVRDMIRQ
jgi:hypothetical protein